MRQCLNCKSTTTYIHTKTGFECWYHYKDGYICHKCYSRIQSLEYKKIHLDERRQYDRFISSPRHLVWTPMAKQITLKKNPRTGQCQLCKRIIGGGFGKGFGFGSGVSPHMIKRTAIHHINYHDDDPLRDTIELCVSCHRKEHIQK